MKYNRSIFIIKHTLLILVVVITGCNQPEAEMVVEEGVSLVLAEYRKEKVTELAYDLDFKIPLQKTDSIPARVAITFELQAVAQDLPLDFKAAIEQIKTVTVNGEITPILFQKGHLFLPQASLVIGGNRVEIDFIAGDLSLNRKADYLYTLLVPDRASTLFPCFDQPNLKAKFTLSLDIPEAWDALANGAILETKPEGDRKQISFKETAPISTYLFAFTAGNFQVEERMVGGRNMRMLYRESDTEKVQRNLPEIFTLHQEALEWMERYTAIPLPFEKFDFALLPGFQYGGMEHVGAIFYRESSLMLDENATPNQQIGRASLIAHETAHMWFGDLVTMEWFSDVWLKEVFANFMAANIVNPGFPELNHDLNFMLRHQPAAYGEDRSGGSHSIQQPLENLKEAGTLYGRIIYQKAPVVMRQLEEQMGAVGLRDGLRAYLRRFAYGNATWDDLINILDERTDQDLKSWSKIWVKSAGMPVFTIQTKESEGQQLLCVEQVGKEGQYWSESTTIALFYQDSVALLPVQLAAQSQDTLAALAEKPLAMLPHASALAYGYFPLTEESKDYLLQHVSTLDDPLLRGAAWICLYEDLLRHRLSVGAFYLALLEGISEEQDALNRNYLLDLTEVVFWQFFTSTEREQYGRVLEQTLEQAYTSATEPSAQLAYFRTYYDIALSGQAISNLEQIWKGQQVTAILPLSETEAIDLVTGLVLRLPDEAAQMIETQLARTKNQDRKERLQFIQPALSSQKEVRDSFFASLSLLENRGTEPWVVDAVGYLHHPLRAAVSIEYLPQSLALMEEIQATGDIFFPRQFITATLGAHQSVAAAEIVHKFLAERPDYPPRLRNKILMAADLLFRTQH